MEVSARVLALDPEGRLLLVSSADGSAWVAPGGAVEPGEGLAACAAREAREEAGVPVAVERLMYVQDLRLRGRRVLECFFLARALGPAPARHADPDGPRRRVRFFARAEVARLPRVFPEVLREAFWRHVAGEPHDPYLGEAGDSRPTPR